MSNYQELAMRTNSTSTGKNPAVSPDLIHAVLGMADELFELSDTGSEAHYVEEAGDFAWFLALAYHAMDKPLDFNSTLEPPLPFTMVEGVLRLSGLVKKPYAYGPKAQVPADEILFTLDGIKTCFCVMLQNSGVSLSHVLSTNIEKLRVRFPDKYEDIRANVRDLQKEAEVLNKPDQETPYDR